MTAWTTISNALVAVGAKPFASTMQALRDNVAAAFEGDSTAVAAGVTLRQAALERLVAGDSIRLRADAVSTVSASTIVLGHRFAQAGQVRCTVAHRHTTGAGTSEVTVVRLRGGGSVTLQTWTTTSTGFVNRSFDADVQPGDVLRIVHRPTGAVSSETANARFGVATGQVVWPTETMAGLVENPLI